MDFRKKTRANNFTFWYSKQGLHPSKGFSLCLVAAGVTGAGVHTACIKAAESVENVHRLHSGQQRSHINFIISMYPSLSPPPLTLTVLPARPSVGRNKNGERRGG